MIGWSLNFCASHCACVWNRMLVGVRNPDEGILDCSGPLICFVTEKEALMDMTWMGLWDQDWSEVSVNHGMSQIASKHSNHHTWFQMGEISLLYFNPTLLDHRTKTTNSCYFQTQFVVLCCSSFKIRHMVTQFALLPSVCHVLFLQNERRWKAHEMRWQ